MTFIVILVLVATAFALAIPFGADSRDLSEHAYLRDSLWSR